MGPAQPMQCEQETCQLKVSNTQKEWQRNHECIARVDDMLWLPRVELLTQTVPRAPCLLLWLAYACAPAVPLQWCERHEQHPLDDDVQTHHNRVKFSFARCTGKCFAQPRLCVALGEWDGARIVRWGWAAGHFRSVDIRRCAGAPLEAQLAESRAHCQRLEEENAVLRRQLEWALRDARFAEEALSW